MHIHILTTTGDSVSDLQTSAVASSRLRLGVAAEALEASGNTPTVGRDVPRGTRLVVVGKVGADYSNTARSELLNRIQRWKSTGIKVALDYSDHHLRNLSPSANFYAHALQLADLIVCPSKALQSDLHATLGTNRDVVVIEDCVEYLSRPAKEPKVTSGVSVLWFGHATNFPALAAAINNGLFEGVNIELTLLSSSYVIELLKTFPFTKPPKLPIKFLPWSMKNLDIASLTADCACLPIDLQSSKQYVSNNRLVTALTLGLPTIASSPKSYTEFGEYFRPLDSNNARAFFECPEADRGKVDMFQRLYGKRFSKQQIGASWLALLKRL